MARVHIVLSKTGGSLITSPKSVTLVDPVSGDAIATLSPVSGYPGHYFADDVPEGTWTLAIDGVPSDHPAYQDMPIVAVDSLGHSHSSGVEATVLESGYDDNEEVAIGDLWRYKLTCRAGYSEGTLDAYLNGLLMPNASYYSDSAPRMAEGSTEAERSSGIFYITTPDRLAGISTTSKYNSISVRFRKPETG
jgi:hypothetical protein